MPAHIAFEPTPAEIKRICAEIREGWDEREERLRRRWRNDNRGNEFYQVPICKVGEL